MDAFTCVTCNARFRHGGALSTHMRTHGVKRSINSGGSVEPRKSARRSPAETEKFHEEAKADRESAVEADEHEAGCEGAEHGGEAGEGEAGCEVAEHGGEAGEGEAGCEGAEHGGECLPVMSTCNVYIFSMLAGIRMKIHGKHEWVRFRILGWPLDVPAVKQLLNLYDSWNCSMPSAFCHVKNCDLANVLEDGSCAADARTKEHSLEVLARGDADELRNFSMHAGEVGCRR